MVIMNSSIEAWVGLASCMKLVRSGLIFVEGSDKNYIQNTLMDFVASCQSFLSKASFSIFLIQASLFFL